ncbi:hypothetical protein [Dyella sp.]|nr:hypothetical protein [Dyella sp.]MDR3443717.1 hypothetical protein [Dyella sp.]
MRSYISFRGLVIAHGTEKLLLIVAIAAGRYSTGPGTPQIVY